LVWAAPDEVERIVDRLEGQATSKKLEEEIGGLVGLLWIGSGRDRARHLIRTWLSALVAKQEFLLHAVSILRGNIIAGYDKPDERANAVRARSLELASWVVDATAAKLRVYFSSAIQTSEMQSEATVCAKLISHVAHQFYFSSGAFQHGNKEEDSGLKTLEQKQLFLSEAGPIIEKISDVATPEVLHHLIDLFEFLAPADPIKIFDLVAHGLLGAGKSQGYQFESLGADRVVEIVGRFLADHRSIFENEDRRRKLIECLDAFIEAGWPSARRLLYRLPELLQ
jgi:hypothetical protein